MMMADDLPTVRYVMVWGGRGDIDVCTSPEYTIPGFECVCTRVPQTVTATLKMVVR